MSRYTMVGYDGSVFSISPESEIDEEGYDIKVKDSKKRLRTILNQLLPQFVDEMEEECFKSPFPEKTYELYLNRINRLEKEAQKLRKEQRKYITKKELGKEFNKAYKRLYEAYKGGNYFNKSLRIRK